MSRLITCLHCDLLQRLSGAEAEAGAAGVVHCSRCGAELLHAHTGSADLPLALALACIPTFLIAVGFPLVSMNVQGATVATTLPGAIVALFRHGMAFLAFVVFVTTLLAPAAQLLFLAGSLLLIRFRRGAPHIPLMFRFWAAFHEWGMLDVLMLGMLVALGKLAAIAAVVPGPALWAYAGLLVLMAAQRTTLSTHDFWRLSEGGRT